jgi:hypothetical protein
MALPAREWLKSITTQTNQMGFTKTALNSRFFISSMMPRKARSGNRMGYGLHTMFSKSTTKVKVLHLP